MEQVDQRVVRSHRDVSRPAMAARVRPHFRLYRYTRWMRDAQPGARVLFGVGDDLASACDAGIAHFMFDFAEFGFIAPFERRPHAEGVPGCLADYLAIRSDRPWPRPFDPESMARAYLDRAALQSLDEYLGSGDPVLTVLAGTRRRCEAVAAPQAVAA